VRLQRRTFISLLAGFAAMVLSVASSFAWPLRWWRKPGADQDEPPAGPAPVSDAADSSGVKITTIEHRSLRDSTQDLSRDPSVLYVRGDWRRLEWPRSYGGFVRPDGSLGRAYGPHVATVIRPDLGKSFELNLDASEYTQGPYPPKKPKPFTKKQMEKLGVQIPNALGSAKPTFRIEVVTKDTGERKMLFGYAARRVITTRKEVPFQGSRRSAQETITDAWYIDLEPRFYPTIYPQTLRLDEPGKPPRAHCYVAVFSSRSPAPPEVPEFVDVGEPETGFAVEETRTSSSSYTLPDGSTRQSEETSETTITIERGTYDAAFFEVPQGFKRVASINRSPTGTS